MPRLFSLLATLVFISAELLASKITETRWTSVQAGFITILNSLISFFVILDIASIITRMLHRRLKPELTTALAEVPAVALLGPGQVGKTTLALKVAQSCPSIYLDLESTADRAKLVEPELYL